MSTDRPDVIMLDPVAVHRIMRIQEFGRNSLAKALKRNPSEIGLWINGKRRITIENAQDIASALHCTIDHLTGKKTFFTKDFTDNIPLPGTPEFYLRAVEGNWLAVSRLAPGKDMQGNPIPEQVFEWEVEIVNNMDSLSGICVCRTPGFEHGQFNLKGEVIGRGFLMVDGVRGIPDGAEDFLRILVRLHSDGRTKRMEGAQVMFWAEFQQIFHGSLSLTPIE